MTQRYIISHTSIRGVAALLVVLYHMQFGRAEYFPWESATTFFKRGYLWVDLFFILSGFVISYSARLDERAPYGWRQKRDFWFQRFARIYPLHLFALLLLLVVRLSQSALKSQFGTQTPQSGSHGPGTIAGFFEQLFLLNGPGITGRIEWNIPSWSISTEMIAYLLFPFLAAFMVAQRKLAIVSMSLFALGFYTWVGATSGVLDIVQREAVLRCLAGFGLGMILYTTRAKFATMHDNVLSLLQAIGAAILLSTFLLDWNDVWAIPGFFLVVAATWTDRGWLAVLLGVRPLHWLGEISYSVYLNHLWVLSGWGFVAGWAVRRLPISTLEGQAIIMVGGMLLVLGISHFTYLLVEQPARKYLMIRYRNRLSNQMTTALPAEKSLT